MSLQTYRLASFVLLRSRTAVLAGLFLFYPVYSSCTETDVNQLIIITDTGEHRFKVELALKGPDQRKGLMHRPSMDENAGMLFVFDKVITARMWMKNTLIPLDMVFIRDDGSVANIHKNARPHSEKTITSSEPVRYVLEINAGLADRIALKRNDKIRHPFIKAVR